jgi:hypothetical protein
MPPGITVTIPQRELLVLEPPSTSPTVGSALLVDYASTDP